MNGEKRTANREVLWLRLALLGGLLAGFGLRLHRLGAESLWYDETVSVVLARKSLGEMLAHTARDIHPPGYYALLHGWQALVAPTLVHGLEFLYAWPSLWAGVLILALLYPLGARLVGRRAAVLAVWLAAVNPFHLWYSQEVRMYTVGAALGMLCLWALLRFLDQERSWWAWLVAYVLAAAAGLYTLYYFAFLLIAINLIALWLLWRERKKPGFLKKLGFWLGAQLATLLLWSPWLPVFWKQATHPPVPPWRAPWEGWASFLATLNESLGALVTGQTPPGLQMWPYALLSLAAVALFLWPEKVREKKSGFRQKPDFTLSRAVLLVYVFAPILILYLLSAVVTPLYHVRYLFTYAPPFMLILAAAILRLGAVQRWLGVAAAVLILGLSAWGLQEFWTNPRYQADDHRGAVAELARNWRPGDLVLVNAGWVYTALDVYWPGGLAGNEEPLTDPLAAAPPPIVWSGRFTDYAKMLEAGQPLPTTDEPPVIVARTGSVDGDPNLGWGDPDSDFFAVSREETTRALAILAEHHPRIWHYRLYDTVSDPEGVIRTWLAEETTPLDDIPYLGRDFLRVQQFETQSATEEAEMPVSIDATFGDALRLESRAPFLAPEAGDIFYVDTEWLALPGLTSLPADLSLSLRLYLGDELALQQDAPVQPSTGAWQPGQRRRQSLALPIPVSTKPLRYRVELVVYRQDTGEPLPPAGDAGKIIDGQRWQLGAIDVFRPPRPPAVDEWLARFDYINLVRATPDRTEAAPGDVLHMELIWLPRPSEYQDAYNAVIELRNGEGDVAQAWSQVTGGENYPSSAWPAGYPVREVRALPLDAGLPPGDYTLTLRLERVSDGMTISAKRGRLGIKSAVIPIGEVSLK